MNVISQDPANTTIILAGSSGATILYLTGSPICLFALQSADLRRAEVSCGLGAALAAVERYERAIGYYERALDVEPDSGPLGAVRDAAATACIPRPKVSIMARA